MIAPKVAAVTASDGTFIEADEKLGGAPSVVYDAVAILAPPLPRLGFLLPHKPPQVVRQGVGRLMALRGI